MHLQVKPFTCKLDECGKQFTQLGNLKVSRFDYPLLSSRSSPQLAVPPEQIPPPDSAHPDHEIRNATRGRSCDTARQGDVGILCVSLQEFEQRHQGPRQRPENIDRTLVRLILKVFELLHFCKRCKQRRRLCRASCTRRPKQSIFLIFRR